MKWAVVRVGILAVCGLLGMAASACAQITVSAAAESDYRFRGISRSYGRPDLRLNINFDHESGAYAGLSVIGYDAMYIGRQADVMSYAGFATRPKNGMSWDVGWAHTHTRAYGAYDYDEVYGGVSLGGGRLRVSYSPDYYGRDIRTLYTDLSLAHRLTPHWRVFGHAGALTPVSGYVRRPRYDLRGGAAVTFGRCDLLLALSQTANIRGYRGHNIGGRALIVSASYAF